MPKLNLYKYGISTPFSIKGNDGVNDTFQAAVDTAVSEIFGLDDLGVFRFIHVTDTHHSATFTDNDKQLYAAIKEVANQISAHCIIHTGDVISGGSSANAAAWESSLTDVKNQFVDCDIPVIFSRGNHDDNSVAGLTAENVITNKWWNTNLAYLVNPASRKIVYPDTGNGYFYVDFPEQKIRVVNTNNSDLTENERLTIGGQNHMVLSTAQLSWLDGVLAVESGWKIIVCGHSNAYNYNPNAGITNRESLYNKISTSGTNVIAYVFGHAHVRSYYKDANGVQFIGGENVGGTRTTFTNADCNVSYASAAARAACATGNMLFDVCIVKHDWDISRVRFGVQPDVIST